MIAGLASSDGPGGDVWVNELATHLPDQILYLDHGKALPFQNSMQGILMFLDISGFTSLCEKYSMNAKNGTDQLTKTLNGYMEALVHEVIKYDGDILKFAGDAILTLWKVESFGVMRSSIHHVIKCAMSVQKKYGEWTTNVGVKLRVKIGIAAGEVNLAYLGNSEFCHYVTMGRAVEAVNLAEKFCVSGDTVVSPTAWCHCSGLPIEIELLDDHKHVKILDVEDEAPGIIPYAMVRTKEVSKSLGDLLRANVGSTEKGENNSVEDHQAEAKRFSLFPDAVPTPEAQAKSKPAVRRNKTENDQAVIRVRNAVIDESISDKINSKIALYIAPPVLKKIEENQPLAYLSEMRQVTILFMNLLLEECSKYELCFTMQQAFNIIHAQVKQMQGLMNKIFMFDKGSTFLVIFGLPGFKHENDCGHALQCAHNLKKELNEVEKITRTSIGVTTGSTFCGVVGHNHRHEYTVIGRKVNMAARLMMYYPDKVTCDNETYHHSKLGKGNFVHLELKEMKGLSNVGAIREFHPSLDPKDDIAALLIQEAEYPIVGRDKELDIFKYEMKQITKNPTIGSHRQVILYEGEVGIGKTKISDAIAAVSLKNNIRVVSCTLSMNDSKVPYYAVKSLISDFMGFNFDQTHQERERLLYNTFSETFILDNLSMLNEILQVKVPPNDSAKAMSEKTKADLLNRVLFRMVTELATKNGLIIFIIDDAHYMDFESWNFVRILGQNMQSLVILTMRMPYKMRCPLATAVMEDKATLRVNVAGLDHSFLAPLACQLLGTRSIPLRLDEVLREKSNGVPTWCEQLLTEMVCDGVLKIVPPDQANPNESMVIPEEHLVGGALPDNSKKNGGNVKVKDAVCIMTRDISSGVPDSIKGMIQARIDRMKESDQMVVKNASILGMSFARVMLRAILPPTMTDDALKKSLSRVAELGIFICATKWKSHSAQNAILKESAKLEKNLCECPDEAGMAKDKALSECQFMRFQSASTQDTAYHMYLERNKRTLHAKAAKYLESQSHKCVSCGGGNPLLGILSDSDNIRIAASRSRRGLEVEAEHSNKQGAQMKQAIAHETNLGVVRTFRPMAGTTQGGNTRRLSTTVEHLIIGMPNKNRRMSNVREWLSSSSIDNVVIPDAFDVSVAGLANALKESRDTAEDGHVDSDMDLRECECADILTKVYPQMVHHWKHAGSIGKTIRFLMEAAGASITTFDHIGALAHLREARNILQATKEERNPFEGDVSNVDSYNYDSMEEARLESLLGQALFHNGNVVDSVQHFTKALSLVGYNLPGRKMGRFFELLKQRFIQWQHNKFPTRFLGKAEGYDATLLVEQARNLSHVLHYYLLQQDTNMALLVVLKQINAAEKADSDFHELIVSYTSMIEICQVLNKPEKGQLYEFKAHARAIEQSADLSVDDQITLAHLHSVSLNSRLVWGQIAEAVDSGTKCYQIRSLCSKLHDNDMEMQMLPIFSLTLMRANRLIDAVDMMRKLEYIQNETEDQIAKAWYYAGCLEALLELGFQIETSRRCIEFAQEMLKDKTFQMAKLPLFCLACSVTLWYQRKSEFKHMEMWQQLALSKIPASLDNFMAANGFVKIIECKLILLSNCMSRQSGTKNKKLLKMLKKEVKSDMSRLGVSCVKMPVFKLRWLHLNAYHRAIQGKMRLAKLSLTKCINLAEKTGNHLEKNWACHSQQVWFDPMYDRHQENFWLDHAEENEQMPDWHLSEEIEGSFTMFSLPLPHWFDN